MNFGEILAALSDFELLKLVERLGDIETESLTREQMIALLVAHEANQLSNSERFYQNLDK